MSRTKTEQRKDKEMYTRSNVVTVRPLTLVRPAETLAGDWLNTNGWQEMVIKSVTSTTYSRNLAPLTWNKRRGIKVSCFPAITIGLRDTTHFASEDDYRTGCPTSVTVNNSPIQDYTHSDDHVCFLFFNFFLFVCFLADFLIFYFFFSLIFFVSFNFF